MTVGGNKKLTSGLVRATIKLPYLLAFVEDKLLEAVGTFGDKFVVRKCDEHDNAVATTASPLDGEFHHSPPSGLFFGE